MTSIPEGNVQLTKLSFVFYFPQILHNIFFYDITLRCGANKHSMKTHKCILAKANGEPQTLLPQSAKVDLSHNCFRDAGREMLQEISQKLEMTYFLRLFAFVLHKHTNTHTEYRMNKATAEEKSPHSRSEFS